MNQTDIFRKYPNGIYWKDLPENEQYDHEGQCNYCWNKEHIGTCYLCHEVIHGQNFYSTMYDGQRVYFHDDITYSCHNEWIDTKIRESRRKKNKKK